ncbi:MAG: ABC transporter ATP-binding protein [Oligoflexus sp.]|jgi:spermidine/putrescine transport system ATP-binding protein
MNAPALLNLQSLHKSYGSRMVIEDLSLSIQHGEFFSLLGPSGCGKSTTLRIIAGFEAPDQGQMFMSGRDITHVPVRSRDMNMVFQNYALFPHMTVFDNVAFGLKMQKKTTLQVKDEVAAALDLVQMSDFAKRLPAQLSGGQQQRVALARAIAPRPTLLLLDEPLGALDQKLRKDMQGELKQLQRRLGITFIFVTHDQDEAMSMSDRLAIMEQGKILQVGCPADIYERPCSREVASFIGEANFLEVNVVYQGYEALATCRDHGFSLTLTNPQDLRQAIRAVALVRPEAWDLRQRGDVEDRRGYRSGRIEELHYRGREILLKVRLGAGRPLLVVQAPQAWMQLDQEVLIRPRFERVRALLSGG